MNGSNIFGPFFAMIGLTMVVWVYMYIRRIGFLNALDIEPDEVTPARLAELSPPAVSNPSDNLKNLFEVPVLFYAIVLYLYVTSQVDPVYTVAAWGFVILRVAHSTVHCTVNIVMVRFYLYAASALALWFMVVRAAWGLIAA